MEPDNRLLRAALRYAELGYKIFPCKEGGSTPLTTHGFQDASADAKQIEQWWHYHPAANIGLVTAGLLVVDIDTATEGEVNPWLQDEPDKLADLASAPTSRTPRGGLHYVFHRPADKGWRCTQGELAPHVDTRTDGGYVVVPPSERVQGAYQWVEGLELECTVAELREPPEWLVAMLDAVASTRATGPATAATARTLGEPGNAIPAGQRNSTLARLAGAMRRNGMTQAEIAAALLVANSDRCLPPLDVLEVQRVAASVAKYEPDQVAVAMAEGHWEQLWSRESGDLQPLSLGKLVSDYQQLRPPVIHGLLRRGETMNVISAPKLMKSWLVTDMALSLATGRQWLGAYATVLPVQKPLRTKVARDRARLFGQLLNAARLVANQRIGRDDCSRYFSLPK